MSRKDLNHSGTPTPDHHRPPVWKHPTYYAIWDRLPFALQIRLAELEGKLDQRFKRRLRVKRRDSHTWLAQTVKLAIIGGLIRVAARLLHH